MAERKQWRLSATAISCFKQCPYKYYLKYIKGIKRAEEPDHFRYGTNWHKIMEIISLTPGNPCPCLNNLDGPADDPARYCPICECTNKVPDDIMTAVTRVIDDAYCRVPNSVDPEDWAVERAKLLYAAAGYNWYYQNEPLKATHTEVKFRTPIPGRTGRMVPNLLIDGVIDKVVKHAGNMVVEHKTTSSSVAPDSKYWGKLTMDTQTTLYTFTLRLLRDRAELELEGDISGFYYDVFHKPGIKPKFLSIADSKKFVANGEYCGGKFNVTEPVTEVDVAIHIFIDGDPGIIEATAKEGQYKIKETSDMYGHRLLADIVERPEYYFARKELAKTDAELDRFHKELLAVFISIRSMYNMDSWYHCEDECENKYNCDYIDMCYNGIDADGELPANLIKKVRGQEDGSNETKTTTEAAQSSNG